MKIVLCGTHSTGKTTVFNSLNDELNLECIFVRSSTRYFEKLGFPINNVSDNYNETQLLIGNKDFQDWVVNRNVNCIFDRCLLDTMIYSQYLCIQNKLDLWILRYQEDMFRLINYDYYLWFQDDIDLVIDDIRIYDLKFRNSIHDLFSVWFNLFNLNDRVIKVFGQDQESRLDSVKSVIIDLWKKK